MCVAAVCKQYTAILYVIVARPHTGCIQSYISCIPYKVLQHVLLAHNPISSLAYPMITHTPPVAGSSPIKTLVARQQPKNTMADHYKLQNPCIYFYECTIATKAVVAKATIFVPLASADLDKVVSKICRNY